MATRLAKRIVKHSHRNMKLGADLRSGVRKGRDPVKVSHALEHGLHFKAAKRKGRMKKGS